MLNVKKRVTIYLDPEILEAARAEVERGQAANLSITVEEALVERQRLEALREALELSDQEHGPISKEAEEWGRRELDRAMREISSSTQGR